MNVQKPICRFGEMAFLLRWSFLLFFVILLGSTSLANENRIVGYLPYYRFSLVDQMELDKLTHLVIAFGHPGERGEVEVPGADIGAIVRKAHAEGVQVLLSLGGGALEEDDEKRWKHYLRPGQRGVFIRNIVQFVYTYDLDGIDVDLEWKYIDENYSGFVLDLERALRPAGKLMTAALPATHRYKYLTDEALAAFDFINIMVYDLTGPFRPDLPGQHSPFSFAVNSINFWKEQGVERHRMTLGLPMFGWNFSIRDTVSSIPYRDLVAMDASFALLDQVGQIYYNGISMIKAKTELALAEVGGVMLWELGQDAYNELSLLRAVHQVMYGEPAETQLAGDLHGNKTVLEGTTVLGTDRTQEDLFFLEPQNGRLMLLRRRNGQNVMKLPIPDYPPVLHFSAQWAYETLLAR